MASESSSNVITIGQDDATFDGGKRLSPPETEKPDIADRTERPATGRLAHRLRSIFHYWNSRGPC
jgi:hypothetical protein